MKRQAPFAEALLDPLAPVPDGLSGPAGIPISTRYAVYRNNVMNGLIEALEAGFPALQTLLGPRYFKAVAAEHARAHPPEHPVLALYGQRFPAWIEAFPPLARYPWCADLARLELARREAHDAPDLRPQSVQQLASIAPEQLSTIRATLHPSLRLVNSRWPVHSLWQHAINDAPRPESHQAQAETVLIVRPGLEVQMQLISAGGLCFVSDLGAGRTLGEAAGSALAEEPASDIPALLQSLCLSGALAALHNRD